MVNVRIGYLPGGPSTNIYVCGVTIAGLTNLKKKNPPINVHIINSVASGYFRYNIIK